jgi:hypothetical protein
MRAAWVLVGIGLVAMAVALAYGFTRGGGWDEVRTLTAYPWFNVSLVDVYVGFALFGAWVAYREERVIVAAAWIVAILTLGNLVACVYAALALRGSGGDWTRFWLGTARG